MVYAQNVMMIIDRNIYLWFLTFYLYAATANQNPYSPLTVNQNARQDRLLTIFGYSLKI